jgi:hypothetical protein
MKIARLVVVRTAIHQKLERETVLVQATRRPQHTAIKKVAIAPKIGAAEEEKIGCVGSAGLGRSTA